MRLVAQVLLTPKGRMPRSRNAISAHGRGMDFARAKPILLARRSERGYPHRMSIAPSETPGRLAGLAQFGRAALGLVLDTALPPLCAACRQPIGVNGGLCAPCWSKVSFIAPPYCERLGIPFPYDPGPGVVSIEAIADPPAYRRARAAVRYGDVASILVHALKYGDRLDLAPLMGRWMANAGRALVADTDAIVPVPLHWRRHWARRFNQAEALAGMISKASGVAVAPAALKRVKATPQQVGLSQSERALNVQGAFRVPSSGLGEVAGRRLLLVDDV